MTLTHDISLTHIAIAALIGGLTYFLYLKYRQGSFLQGRAWKKRDDQKARRSAANNLITDPVSIAVKAGNFVRGFSHTKLTYTITITNMTDHAISDLLIEGDLVSAHSKSPRNQQLADAQTALPPIATAAVLPPHQSLCLHAEVCQPVHGLRVIMHGRAMLFLPLLRMRLTADDIAPVAHNFVIGRENGHAHTPLRPFRLDELNNHFEDIGLRALGAA